MLQTCRWRVLSKAGPAWTAGPATTAAGPATSNSGGGTRVNGQYTARQVHAATANVTELHDVDYNPTSEAEHNSRAWTNRPPSKALLDATRRAQQRKEYSGSRLAGSSGSRGSFGCSASEPAPWDWSSIRTDPRLFRANDWITPATPQQHLGHSPAAGDKGKSTLWAPSAPVVTLERPVQLQSDGPDKLPTTEPELFRLLITLSRLRSPRVQPEWIAWFHSRDEFRHLVSNRTYALVLSLAFRRASNLGLVDDVLNDMKERGMHRQADGYEDRLARALLKGYVRRGDQLAVARTLETMRLRGWGGLAVFNWRRNLGAKSRGRGDREVEWKARKGFGESESRSDSNDWQRQRQRRLVQRQQPATVVDFRPMSLTRLQLAVPRVPPDPSTLAKEDAAMLVEALVQHRRTPEATDLAEEWLAKRRATLMQEAVDGHMSPQVVRTYNATAVVMMNTLLKTVIFTSPALTPIQSFVSSFATRNSLPSPALPVVPQRSTIRTVLTGLGRTLDAFKKGSSFVAWVYKSYGVPGPRHSTTTPPPSHALRPRFGSRPNATSVDADLPDRLRVCLQADASVSVLLLRLALDDWTRFGAARAMANQAVVGKRPARLSKCVRFWWDGLDRTTSLVDDRWDSRVVKEVEVEAVEAGLLDWTQDRRDRLAGLRRRRARAQVKAAGGRGQGDQMFSVAGQNK